MKSKARIAIVCVVLTGLAGVLWMAIGGRRGEPMLTYSQFLERVRAGQVASVVVIGSDSAAPRATGSLKDGRIVHTVLPSPYRDALLAMQDQRVDIEIQAASGPVRFLLNATPFLLLLGVWIFIMIRRPLLH